MKRLFRQMAAFLAFCVLAASVPPMGLAADFWDTYIDMSDALLNAQSNETIRLTGNSFIEIPSAKESGTTDPALPWIINNEIIVDGAGYSLTVVGTGILLGADATFQNITLNLPTTDCRNAIIANGHNLTLKDVKAGTGTRSINLFGGTLIPSSYETDSFQVPAPGTGGIITVQGNTNLQGDDTFGPANIYAGSLSMGYFGLTADEAFDGPGSVFNGSVTIDIQGSAGSSALGTVYAGGAQQRRVFGTNYVGGKVTSPDAGKYTVSGTVTISGTNAIPNVDGAGATATNVVYRGDNNQAPMTFQNISSLSVETGNLELNQDSCFRSGGALFLSSGAKLDLQAFRVTTLDGVGSYHSEGGFVFLAEDQTWRIEGQVSGTTKVVIGSLSSNGTNSMTLPTVGYTYISAPNSSGAIFELLPYSNQPDMTLENDGSGNWVATQPTQEASKLVSLGLPTEFHFRAVSEGDEVFIPLNPTYTVDSPFLDTIPLTVCVDGKDASAFPDKYFGYRYEADSIHIYVADYNDGEGLSVYSGDSTFSVPPDGTYTIQITVPGEHTATGNPITASCTLTVGDSAPTVTTIPVPTANTGLKWTGEEQTGVSEGTGYTLTGHTGTAVGEYTATATLQDGYQWTGGSADPQTIKWSIAKADGPAAPGNLSATAPTTAGGNDGTITGTTAAMEYAADSGFSDKKPCGEGSTGGLAAGKYYVRVKGTATHEPGAYTSITVPAPGAPTVTGISVSSTDHKTEYRVGEFLDVTGLTIDVAYSDGSKQTVPVTEGMVGGFDSSKAAESQTLTITHEGHKTTYTIRITASGVPGKPQYQVTLNNLGDGGSGEGSYEERSTVAIRAGSKSGYTFSAWQQPEGVTLADRNSPETSFTMPGRDVTLLATWTRNGGITPPGHTHVWSSAWESSAAHHWHDCTASGCTVADNSEKSGYAAHTAGDWVVDQPAASSQNGTRHRSCTVCGYEMARETIPATGGGSSSGGSSSGGSSSSDGSSSSGSSSNTTTVKNPDGSTTATNTNKTTGTVTETTRRPDGSKLVVETKKDGTVTATDTAKDGSTVKTVARPDGTSETTVKRADGLTASVREDGNGARADVRLPSKVVKESQSGGGAVALPIPELPGANASVTVRTGSVRPVRVEIPVRGDENTTVACVVNGDGTETILKTAVLTGGQITVSVPDGTTLRLRDNGRDFRDTRGHWAEDAIDFAASRELFAGKTSTTFAPDAPMSRAMLTTVLARLDGVDAAGGAAYEKGMAWAVTRGVSDGRNPEGQVTREQFVAMLYRYAGSPAATDRELHFSDEAAISGYAREAVRWAVENGILSGYGNGSFAPGGKATRAQAAVMLTRYVNYLNGK